MSAGATLLQLFEGDTAGAYRVSGPACVSFSGGRTSAFMLAQILDASGGSLPPDVHVLFANTGKERPETLDFVRECGEHWGVDIVWLEYDGRGGRLDYREVSFETASRDGQPFEVLINHRGAVPNLVSRWCTSVLKVDRIRAWMRGRGYEHWVDLVGLRADEPARASKRRAACDDEVDYALPLADAGVTVEDVRAFWRAQPFDLRLESNEGNCDLCHMKMAGTLRGLIARDPSAAAWWSLMEQRTGRRFAKGYSYDDLLAAATVPVERLTGRAKALAESTEAAMPCACTD
jgi:3'-phosphoadenosine 5'-phosphosulfate sulfotransferase (PAPS reductase)/FAD synthetase